MENRRLLEFRKPRTGEVLSFKTRQYFVTEDGRVYDGTRKRFVKQHENQYGYMTVALRDDCGKQHTCIRVHNLVASVFQRLLDKGEEVHHRNHNPKSNQLENLEIISASEHSRHHNIEKWACGTYDGVAEKLSKQVAQLTKDGRLIKVWPSTMEAGRNGYNFSHVSDCCNGKRKYHKGYVWQWLEDYQKQQKEEANLDKLASS